MQLVGNSPKNRQKRVTIRLLISVIGLVAIMVLMYLIGQVQIG